MKTKPRIFIGSSVEGLDIAYAIQENLDYEVEAVVWPQGTFELNSIPLNDLITQASNVDYAIFVFTPDDILKSRNSEFQVARDNVIFELGLFIGFLGQMNCFIVKPKDVDNLHLPSDLAGITCGDYFSARSDGNILASLGPFCNKVRRRMGEHTKSVIYGFDAYPEEIKTIVRDKPKYWEFVLIEKLLKHGMIPLNRAYDSISKGLYFSPKRKLTPSEIPEFLSLKMREIMNLMNMIKRAIFEDKEEAIGKFGESGDPLKIEQYVDRLLGFGRALLQVESDVEAIETTDRLMPLVGLHKGLTETVINTLNQYAEELSKKCNDQYLQAHDNKLEIELKIEYQESLDQINEFITKINNNPTYYLVGN